MSAEVAKLVRTDSGLSSALRISVMRLARRLRSERDPAHDLSLNQLSALGALDRHGAMTVGQLAAHERVQPPSMTRTIAGLVERGLAVRQPHPTDGRQVVVALSDAGRDLVLAERRRKDAWLSQRLRELSADEREALRRAAPVLERLAQS